MSQITYFKINFLFNLKYFFLAFYFMHFVYFVLIWKVIWPIMKQI